MYILMVWCSALMKTKKLSHLSQSAHLFLWRYPSSYQWWVGSTFVIFFQTPILYITAQFKGTFRLTMKRKLIQMQCHLEGFQTILGAEHCPIKYLRANFHAGANQLQWPCTGEVSISLAESRFFSRRHALGDFMILLAPIQAMNSRTLLFRGMN